MTPGDRLKLVRELLGITQTDLANQLDVSSSTIAYIETGRLALTERLLELIFLRTGFPPGFFTYEGENDFELSMGSLTLYRARKSATSKELSQIHRYAQLIVLCIARLRKRVSPLPVKIPRLDEPPQIAAEITRASLGLSPDKPIPNVVNRIEKAGCFAIPIPVSVPAVDGFSCWISESTGPASFPLIASVGKWPGDRVRFSAAHELGHLVLHHSMRGNVPSLEHEANAFAREFLVPEAALLEELESPPTLTSLMRMKERWGVSMQMLIMHSGASGLISERGKRYLFEKFRKEGWHKQEPIEVAIERPRLFGQMAELVYGPATPIDRIAKDLMVPPSILAEILRLHATTLHDSGPNLAGPVANTNNLVSFQ